MKLVYWIGRNLPGLIFFGLATMCIFRGYTVHALFYLVMVNVFAMYQGISDLRDRLDALTADSATSRPNSTASVAAGQGDGGPRMRR